MRAQPWCPNHLPKSPSPNTITWVLTSLCSFLPLALSLTSLDGGQSKFLTLKNPSAPERKKLLLQVSCLPVGSTLPKCAWWFPFQTFGSQKVSGHSQQFCSTRCGKKSSRKFLRVLQGSSGSPRPPTGELQTIFSSGTRTQTLFLWGYPSLPTVPKASGIVTTLSFPPCVLTLPRRPHHHHLPEPPTMPETYSQPGMLEK